MRMRLRPTFQGLAFRTSPDRAQRILVGSSSIGHPFLKPNTKEGGAGSRFDRELFVTRMGASSIVSVTGAPATFSPPSLPLWLGVEPQPFHSQNGVGYRNDSKKRGDAVA
jgi:hypothetical protein